MQNPLPPLQDALRRNEATMSNCAKDPASETEVVWLDDTDSGRADPPAERVLSIGNVARMFGVSQLALRYYEFRGLIRRRHSLDGVRVYGWADCERLAFIIKCRKAGVMLGDIVMIIQATDDDISPLQFKTGQETCMGLVDRLERRRRVIDDALAELSHVYALLTTKLLGDTRPGGRD
jgi:DNA-binding transcriptional MerR regulator